jgi:hypothetical protein
MCLFLEAILKMTNIVERNPDDLSCELRLRVPQNAENSSPPIRLPCNLASCNSATRNANPTCRVVAWTACSSSSQDAKYGSREYSSSSRFFPFFMSSRERKWFPACCCIPQHVTTVERFPWHFAHISVQSCRRRIIISDNLHEDASRRCTPPWRYLFWIFYLSVLHIPVVSATSILRSYQECLSSLAADFFPIISVIISIRFLAT